MGSPHPGGRVRSPLAQVYRVGEPFYPGNREWPPGADFAFGPAGYELTLFHREIAPAVEDAVRRGTAEFALIVRPSLIVLAYRFGDAIPWGTPRIAGISSRSSDGWFPRRFSRPMRGPCSGSRWSASMTGSSTPSAG